MLELPESHETRKIVLVRHAQPIIDPELPSKSWPLSDEGREASRVLALFLNVDCGSVVWSSEETKANETAHAIAHTLGLDVASDGAFDEVARPWAGDKSRYGDLAQTFLRGASLPGWEERQNVIDRFSRAVERLQASHDGEHLIVVTHGLAMTAYLDAISVIDSRTRQPVDAAQFWAELSLPDAWRFDINRGWLDRIGYTWDGDPIAREPPFGTAVLVYRRESSRLEFLLLHRAGLGELGDWAWTPPAGARLPGEDVVVCAKRELREETGLTLEITPTEFGDRSWPQFLAEVSEADVRLSAEHDRWEWVEAIEACERCRPAVVADAMRRALEFLKSNV